MVWWKFAKFLLWTVPNVIVGFVGWYFVPQDIKQIFQDLRPNLEQLAIGWLFLAPFLGLIFMVVLFKPAPPGWCLRVPFVRYMIDKQTLQDSVPLIVSQIEGGYANAGPILGTAYNDAFLRERARLRTTMILLEIPFPDAEVATTEWSEWIGFLEALRPLAKEGNIKRARSLLANGPVDPPLDPNVA